jgi:hypothetical protein
MKSTILTILPHPSERQAGMRPALTGASSAQRTEALAVATPDALPSIESVILQKLLAEVEARQLTRAQPAYVIEQPTAAAARQTALVRTLWSLLWVSSFVVCVFLDKYIDSQTTATKADADQSQALENLALSIGDQKRQVSAMIDSLQGLAGTITLNSKRTAAIPEMLDRLGTDLRQMRSPLMRQAARPVLEPAIPTITVGPQEADVAPIPMGGHHHPPIQFAVAPADVVVHHNSLGTMDYWLMPRLISGVWTMAKVVPVSQSKDGTFVHHVDEVKDYIVTPSGDWIPAGEENASK